MTVMPQRILHSIGSIFDASMFGLAGTGIMASVAQAASGQSIFPTTDLTYFSIASMCAGGSRLVYKAIIAFGENEKLKAEARRISADADYKLAEAEVLRSYTSVDTFKMLERLKCWNVHCELRAPLDPESDRVKHPEVLHQRKKQQL